MNCLLYAYILLLTKDCSDSESDSPRLNFISVFSVIMVSFKLPNDPILKLNCFFFFYIEVNCWVNYFFCKLSSVFFISYSEEELVSENVDIEMKPNIGPIAEYLQSNKL